MHVKVRLTNELTCGQLIKDGSKFFSRTYPRSRNMGKYRTLQGEELTRLLIISQSSKSAKMKKSLHYSI
jgi:hypothetical protein